MSIKHVMNPSSAGTAKQNYYTVILEFYIQTDSPTLAAGKAMAIIAGKSASELMDAMEVIPDPCNVEK